MIGRTPPTPPKERAKPRDSGSLLAEEEEPSRGKRGLTTSTPRSHRSSDNSLGVGSLRPPVWRSATVPTLASPARHGRPI